MDQPTLDETQTSPRCPFHVQEGLPLDGTPLVPSPTLAELRATAPAMPMRYADGHVGFIVTDYELGKRILGDPRFSQQPKRMPTHVGERPDAALDAQAVQSLAVGQVLNLDSPQHEKIRRTMTSRLSVKSVRGHEAGVREIVERQLEQLKAAGSPADLTTQYALPISAYAHCLVLGVPEEFVESYVKVYNEESTNQEKFDFVRIVLAAKVDQLGEDALSDLLRAGLDPNETEGAGWMLMSAGRDNVARMISTIAIALLQHPEQLAALRANPELFSTAVEEFLRFGTVFLSLFPRTATEEVVIDDLTIEAGQSVSVSAVAANRDPNRFEQPDDFDVTRDAFGHLAFGFGAHSCVGQQLARLELREAIKALVLGLPTLRLVSAEQLEPMPLGHPVGQYDTGAVIVEW